MILSMIAAVDKNMGIGNENKLLFNIKEDLEWFKQHTHGKPIIMGRSTFESIGKPLKKRINVVLSRNYLFNPGSDVLVRHSVSDILNEFRNELEVVVIGGETIYRQFLPYADRLYITEIDKEKQADTFFPKFNKNEWIKRFSKRGTDDTGFSYSFNVYKKSNKGEG